jgi:hypothetical protein
MVEQNEAPLLECGSHRTLKDRSVIRMRQIRYIGTSQYDTYRIRAAVRQSLRDGMRTVPQLLHGSMDTFHGFRSDPMQALLSVQHDRHGGRTDSGETSYIALGYTLASHIISPEH